MSPDPKDFLADNLPRTGYRAYTVSDKNSNPEQLTYNDLVEFSREMETSPEYKPQALYVMHPDDAHFYAANFHGWSDWAFLKTHFTSLAKYAKIADCVNVRLAKKEPLSLDSRAVMPELWRPRWNAATTEYNEFIEKGKVRK
jgi:hypothetical protein